MPEKLRYITAPVPRGTDPEFVPGEFEEQPEFNAERIARYIDEADAWTKKHMPELYAKTQALKAKLRAAGKLDRET